MASDARYEFRKARGIEVRANQVPRARRKRMVLELRAAGLTGAEIAEQMTNAGEKITERSCNRIIQNELAKLADDNRMNLEEIRALDLHRIDQALKVLWPKVREGNLKAMREWRAFIDQRARLLGTYAAQKHEVKGQVEHVLGDDARQEIARLEEAFLAASSGEEEAIDVTYDEQIPEAHLLEP